MLRYILPGLITMALIATGCSSKTSTGAMSGGAVGASAGGVTGGNTGAVVGVASGAVISGLVGAALDDQDRRIMEQSSPRTVERMDRNEPLTVNDVIKLHEGGVSDDTVIQYIRDSKTKYSLTQAQIRRLQNAGVSKRVTDYMMDTTR